MVTSRAGLHREAAREAGTEEQALPAAPTGRDGRTQRRVDRPNVKQPRTTSGGERALALSTIGGRVWEGAKLPPSGARKRKLSGPPCKGETRELTMTRRLQTGFSPAASERCPALQERNGKAPGAASLAKPRRRASGNCSRTNAAKRLAPRTNSGGRPACGPTDWVGVRGRQSLPRLAERGGSRSLRTSFFPVTGRSGAKRLPEEDPHGSDDCPRPQLPKEQTPLGVCGKAGKADPAAQTGPAGPSAPHAYVAGPFRAPVPRLLAASGHERKESTQRQRPSGLLCPGGRPVDS